LFAYLTSAEALRAYSNLQSTDRELWEELNGLREVDEEGIVTLEEALPFGDDNDLHLDNSPDDSAVTTQELISSIVNSPTGATHEQGMSADGPAEDLDATADVFDFDNPDIQNFGRSKGRRVENKRYPDWRDELL
jgi:hypothetical protein